MLMDLSWIWYDFVWFSYDFVWLYMPFICLYMILCAFILFYIILYDFIRFYIIWSICSHLELSGSISKYPERPWVMCRHLVTETCKKTWNSIDYFLKCDTARIRKLNDQNLKQDCTDMRHWSLHHKLKKTKCPSQSTGGISVIFYRCS